MRLIALIAFIIPFFALSQKIGDYSLKHSMKQDGLALQFTVLDPDKKGIGHYETDKIYFWYKAQRVMGTQGGSSGQLLHGAYESFYVSKQLCEKGSYIKGLKNGEWQYWRMDGTLLRTEHWKNGALKGEQFQYSEKGIVQKRTVIRGRKTKTACGDTLIEISGRSKKITLTDSLGRKLSVERYNGELLHGKQETFASDGSKTVVSYKKGVLVAPKVKKQETEEKQQAETAEPASRKGFFGRMKEKIPSSKAPKESSKRKKEKTPKAPKPAKEKKERPKRKNQE